VVNVVMNIDDVGVLCSVNAAALDILRRGVVRSASVLAPAPWTPGFVRAVLSERLDVDVGVHLALNSEWPACRLRPILGDAVPSLVDGEGYLHASVEALAAADPEEARRELMAQVAHVTRLGVAPSHLDAHMLFYESGERLRAVLFDVAAALDLPVLLYCAGSIAAARARGVRAPDFGTLANYWFATGERRAGYDQLVHSLPAAGTSALTLHPAIRSSELEVCMGADEADHRAEEHEIFSAAAFPLPVRVRAPRDVWGAG
jgi:chitin disaccharide deacetylase